MNFKIVTDSTASLSAEYAIEKEISVVTLYYVLEGKTHPAFDLNDDAILRKFYDQLKNRPKLSTSCANENQYFEEFEKAVKNNQSVLYIGFSNGVSATFNSAILARDRILEEYPNAEIYCVDTLTGSLGQRRFVQECVLMRESGKTAKEARDYVLNNRSKLNTYVTVDDLYYLYQGGRLSSISYKIGSFIKIKHIIKVKEEGKLVALSKVISRKQSLTSLIKIIENNITDDKSTTVSIAHADCKEDAISMADKIKKSLNVNVEIDLLEPVIASHTGVGSIAIFFVSNKI